MFEVVISTVSTGRVQRKFFETREKADRYVERRMAKASNDVKGTARRYRFEVYQRPLPVAKPVPAPVAA